MKSDVQNRILRRALLTRAFEEKILELFQKGHVRGTVHTCIGQEFVGAVLAENLIQQDSLFSNHRGHGHFLSVVGNERGLLAEILGLEEGICKGQGGSQHLHQGNFYSNGIQGGMTAVAVGSALAKKSELLSKQSAEKSISVVFLGDGTFGEGLVYESLNMASKFSAPVLFLIEDNGIAQSTPSELTLAGTYEARAKAFEISYFEGNTWEWEKLAEISAKAVDHVRQKQRPAVLRVQTCRLKAHSKGDDTRTQDVLAANEAKDPLNSLLKVKQHAEVYKDLKEKLMVLADELVAKKPLAFSKKADLREQISWQAQSEEAKFYSQALNESFHRWMKEDAATIFLGEDILSPYGGAFKVAQDLSVHFKDRVISTPISEAAIVGISAGLALEQKVPIAEIMFGDFLGLAFDQILNHAAKFQEMYGLQRPFKMLIRTPMGGGRAYGPTHSQSLEKHFLGIPGLKVIAANGFVPAAQLVEGFRKDSGVLLFCENKKMYSSKAEPMRSPFEVLLSKELYPTSCVRVKDQAPQITLLSYGGITKDCVEAAHELYEKHGIAAQVLSPSQIYPFSISTIASELTTSRALLVVEEGQGFAGFGAEVAAQVLESQALRGLSFERCTAEASIIPASASLEKEVLPSTSKIVQRALSLAGNSVGISKLSSVKLEATKSEVLSFAKQLEVQALSKSKEAINSRLTVEILSQPLLEALSKKGMMLQSLTPLIVFETFDLIKSYPKLNSYYEDQKIHYYPELKMGFALDTGHGLKVAHLDVSSFANAAELEERIVELTLNDLREKSKAEDFEATTFTVTDLSPFQVWDFDPVINGNQAAILGIGGDSSLPGSPLRLILTFDHRLLSGRECAEFLKALKHRLSSYLGDSSIHAK